MYIPFGTHMYLQICLTLKGIVQLSGSKSEIIFKPYGINKQAKLVLEMK